MISYLKASLLFSILLLTLSSHTLQAKERGLNIDPNVAIKEITDQLQSDLIQKLYTGTEQKLMDETEFKILLEPYTNYVDTETPFTDQGLAFYHKIKEDTKDLSPEKRKAYFKSEFQDNIKGYVKGMIYNKVFDKESQNIISTFGTMLTDALDEVKAMGKAQSELDLAENSDEYAAILKKYGITGKWVDKVSALKGKMDLIKSSKTVSNLADAYGAFSTIRTAMNSKNPGHKIEALFHLGATFGGRVPILGKFIELYFQVALEYLKACDGIAKSLRKFDQYCIGQGTHGWIDSSYADKRNVAFAKQFKNDGGTYCRGPAGVYLDIYTATSETGATANRLYFWVNGKWVYGKESHGGMKSLQHIIQWLRKNSHDKKATDVAFLAKEYNKGKGFDVFVETISKLIEHIQSEYHRVYETIDTCDDTKVKDFMMNNGQMKIIQTFLGKDRNYEWDSLKYFYESMKEDMIDEFIHRRLIKPQASNLNAVVQALEKIHPSYVKGKVFNEYGGFASGAKVDSSNANLIFKDSSCYQLTTSQYGSFHFVIDLSNASSVSLTLKAQKDDRTSESISETIQADTYHTGIKIYFKADTQTEESSESSSSSVSGEPPVVLPPPDINVTDGNTTKPPVQESNTTGPTPPEDNTTDPCQCSIDTDCAVGEICSDCACVALAVTKCSSDADCAPGEICSENNCIPSPLFSCTSDADCIAGETCSDNVCISLPVAECVTDADCAADQSCSDGGCITHTVVTCKVDSDCPVGNICSDESCVSVAVPECITDADCAEGQSCSDNTCITMIEPDCTSDADCLDGESCSDNICIMPMPDCISDADCPSGEICSGESCIVYVPECTSNSDCASDQICKNETCITAPPVTCTSDHDCPLDKTCSLSGICIASAGAGAYDTGVWDDREADREGEVNDRYAQDTQQELLDRYNRNDVDGERQTRIDKMNELAAAGHSGHHQQEDTAASSEPSTPTQSSRPSKPTKPPTSVKPTSSKPEKESKLNYYIISTKSYNLQRTAKCYTTTFEVKGPIDIKGIKAYVKEVQKYADLRKSRYGYPIVKSVKVSMGSPSKTKPKTPAKIEKCTPCPSGQHIGLDKDKQRCHGESTSFNLSNDAKKSLSTFGAANKKGSW